MVIALLGNPFSPGYARARARSPHAPALDYCAMNVAVYGPRGRHWCLREQVVPDLGDAASMRIGRSSMAWTGDGLVMNIDECATPFGKPVRGTIRLLPETTSALSLTLDARREHQWWPVAPRARIEVALTEPSLRFSGDGYHDANAGTVPLDATFSSWSWARAHAGEDALVTYDVRERSGATAEHALRISHRGEVALLDGLGENALSRSLWGLPRHITSDRGAESHIRRSLEDGPFYSRALVETRLDGRDVLAMQETLSADRLRREWVRFLAGFRMGHAT